MWPAPVYFVIGLLAEAIVVDLFDPVEVSCCSCGDAGGLAQGDLAILDVLWDPAYSYAYIEHLTSDGVSCAFDSTVEVVCSETFVTVTIDYGNAPGVHDPHIMVCVYGTMFTTGSEGHHVF